MENRANLLDVLAKNRRLKAPLLSVLALLACPILVSANEIGGNNAWNFMSAGERQVALQGLDMMMRRNAGGYSNTYNQQFNSYIAGDQVNCSVSATAAGNTGSGTATGASSSPSVGNTPNIYAQATGSTLAAQNATAPLNSGQTNTSSPQSAGVSGTTSSVGVSNLQATGGYLSQALNSTQSNVRSPQTATVSGSTACGSAGSVR